LLADDALRARLGFAAVRLAGALASARPEALPPAGRRAAVHLTAVVRLPPELGIPLAQEAAALAGDHPLHLAYGADALHVTVLSLDELLAPPERVAAVAARHAPFALDLDGLVLGPSSVLVRALPRDGWLAGLRRELAGLLAPEPALSPRQLVVRRLAHVTLLRLASPASSELRRAVAARSRTRYGTLTVDGFDVMRSDLLLSSASRPLLRPRLAGRRSAR
jgi:2'-5' RNA ligase